MTTAGFATINPIATLVPPVDNPTKPERQPIANAAHTLVQQFSEPESTQARTRSVWTMARELTCQEFDAAMTKALESAASMDKASGWKPAGDAKGRDKYGPRQSTLATLASQCRQVFGACKIDPELFFSTADGAVVNSDLFPNWSTAYNASREYLKDKGVNWQGSPLSAEKAARQNKREASENADIFNTVSSSHPKAMGESMADYMARIAPMMDAAADDAHNAKVTESATKELTRLIKVYGADVADILEAMVIRHNAMQGEESPL
jgi:hypothetical protein